MGEFWVGWGGNIPTIFIQLVGAGSIYLNTSYESKRNKKIMNLYLWLSFIILGAYICAKLHWMLLYLFQKSKNWTAWQRQCWHYTIHPCQINVLQASTFSLFIYSCQHYSLAVRDLFWSYNLDNCQLFSQSLMEVLIRRFIWRRHLNQLILY